MADGGIPSVLQLALSLSPGGTERLVIDLVKRLAGRYRMAVCCLDDAGAWGRELAGEGVPVVALNRRSGFHPWLGRRIAEAADAHGASIIHCHHYSPFVYGRLATLWNRRLRILFTEHGRLSDAPISAKRRLANAVLGRYRGPMFAVSANLRDRLVAEGFSSRMGVIHNGIDVGPLPGTAERRQARAALGIGDEAVVVGTAARLDPVKDLPALVEAVAQVRRSSAPVRLVIVGDGPERAAVEHVAADHGMSDSLCLTGYRADVRDLLAGFDVYANSSISEGISLTILEGMAAGLPVVATGVGGTPEVVIDGETGVLVPARAPTALAQALTGLVHSPERRSQLGRAGRARVVASFAIERMVEDYAREYDQLLGRGDAGFRIQR